MQTIARFVNDFPTKHFSQNESIIMQGASSECIYAVRSGFIKGYDISTNGIEQLLWFGATGDFFPTNWIFAKPSTSTFFYDAFTDVELYCVARSQLISFLQTNNQASFELTQRYATNFNDALNHLNATGKPRAEEKLLHLLYFLARTSRVEKHRTSGIEIALPLTHQHIANLLGLTRETVAVELKKLKDRKLVFYDRWHFVVYQDRLEQEI